MKGEQGLSRLVLAFNIFLKHRNGNATARSDKIRLFFNRIRILSKKISTPARKNYRIKL